MRILISAGEASGDLYAARVVEALKARGAEVEFFGCAGPRMQAAGVRPIIDQRSIAVVGLVEVLAHIPRIWRQFRKLARAASEERPDLAVLVDAPDFHLRLAKKLKRAGIPVVYLIAPQAWAWREGRVKTMKGAVKRLLCIFPFEQKFFEARGVPTSYIGHPLARIVKPGMSRAEFCAKFQIPEDARIVVLLPGSRHGEVARHIPDLVEAASRIQKSCDVRFVLALPAGFRAGFQGGETTFWQRVAGPSIQRIGGLVIEGHTWDALAHAEIALAASGTVTIEAAMLGVPMVTFYRVNALSWIIGRWMVRAPFLSMANLVAGRKIVPELIQHDMTPDAIAAEAVALLRNPGAREKMRADLREVARKLSSERDPMEAAAEWVERVGRNHE